MHFHHRFILRTRLVLLSARCWALTFILLGDISAAKTLDASSIDELVAMGLAQNAELQSYEAAVAEVKG